MSNAPSRPFSTLESSRTESAFAGGITSLRLFCRDCRHDVFGLLSCQDNYSDSGAAPYGKGFAIAIVALGPEVLWLKAKLAGNQAFHTRIGAPEHGVQRLALYTIFTRQVGQRSTAGSHLKNDPGATAYGVAKECLGMLVQIHNMNANIGRPRGKHNTKVYKSITLVLFLQASLQIARGTQFN